MKVEKIFYFLLVIAIAVLPATVIFANNAENPVEFKLSTQKEGFEGRNVFVATFTNVSDHGVAIFMPFKYIELDLIVNNKNQKLLLKNKQDRKILSFLILYPGEIKKVEFFVGDYDFQNFPSGKYQLKGRYKSFGLSYLTGLERIGLRSVYGAHHEPSFDTYEYPAFLQGLLSYRVVKKGPKEFELVLFCKKEAVKSWEIITETNSSSTNFSLAWPIFRKFGHYLQ